MPPDSRLRDRLLPERETVSAIFFSVLMILSLLAMGAVFPAAPVAAEEDDDEFEPIVDDFEDYDVGDEAPGEWDDGEVVEESYSDDQSQSLAATESNHADDLDVTDVEVTATVRPEEDGAIKVGNEVQFLIDHDLGVAEIFAGDWVEEDLPDDVEQDEWTNVRIEGDEDEYRFKVWAAGTAEPDEWTVTAAPAEVGDHDPVGPLTFSREDTSTEFYVEQVDAQPASYEGGSDGLVTGTVTDQNGDPVPEDTTVEAWGVSETAFELEDPEEIEAEAEALLEELDDPLPDAYDPDYDLDAHQDASGDYLLAHAESDWGVGTTTIVDSSIEEPRINIPSDERVVLSLWDPSVDGGLVENQVDQSFPGATTDGEIVVEQRSPTGEVIDSTTHETETIAETTGANPFSTTEHPGVVTDLPPGVYTVYPADAPERGYTIVAGDPDELASGIQSELQTEADELTDRASEIQDRLETDEIVRETTTTDADGAFEIELGDDVVTADIRALRADGELLAGEDEPTIEDLREARLDGTYNGTVLLPSPTPTTVEPPAEDVSLDVYRTDTVPFDDIESYADLMQHLEDERLSEEVDELRTDVDQRLDEFSTAALEQRYQDHRTLVETAPGAEDRYLERSTFDSIQDVDDLDRDQTETEIREMQIVLSGADLIDRAPGDEDAIDVGDGELTTEYPLPNGLDEDTITVELLYADGEVETLAEDDWTIESDGFTGETLVIEDYPVESDAAAVDVRVRAAGEDGVIDDRVSAPLPDALGDVPDVNVALGTLAPGADEQVSGELTTSDRSAFGGITSVEAVGPDGTAVDAERTTARTFAFDTSGEGDHHVRVTYENEAGETLVRSFRVRAYETSRDDPATVRAERGVAGAFALTGERLSEAEIETDGSTIAVTAQTPTEDVPSRLVVKPDAVVQSTTTTLDIDVVEGPDRTSPDSNIAVDIHVDRLSGDALLWRGESSVFADPITQDGATRHGELVRPDDADSEKGVIRTYTDPDGTVTVEVIEEPDWWDRAQHQTSVLIPMVPFVGAATLGVALRRRRRRA